MVVEVEVDAWSCNELGSFTLTVEEVSVNVAGTGHDVRNLEGELS